MRARFRRTDGRTLASLASVGASWRHGGLKDPMFPEGRASPGGWPAGHRTGTTGRPNFMCTRYLPGAGPSRSTASRKLRLHRFGLYLHVVFVVLGSSTATTGAALALWINGQGDGGPGASHAAACCHNIIWSPHDS